MNMLWEKIAANADLLFSTTIFRPNLIKGFAVEPDSVALNQLRKAVAKGFYHARFLKFDNDLYYGENVFLPLDSVVGGLEDLAMPFPSIWIEMADMALFHLSFGPRDRLIKANVDALLLYQYSADEIFAFCFCTVGPELEFGIIPSGLIINNKVNLPEDVLNPRLDKAIHSTASYYLNLLRSPEARFGREFNPNAQTISFRRSNNYRDVQEVITVVPKRKANPRTTGIRFVEWTHMWEVMGHWRKVEGKGKDRFGNYCVEGLTWVNPHQKGAGELITKNRTYKANHEPSCPEEPRQEP